MPMLRAREMEKLSHPTIDGAELWTRTIFDNVSVIRKMSSNSNLALTYQPR